jgi:hypothetical protein
VDEQPALREFVGIVVQPHPFSLRTLVRFGRAGAVRSPPADLRAFRGPSPGSLEFVLGLGAWGMTRRDLTTGE